MYGLPSGVDLSFLTRAELIQVGLGLNEIILYFEPNVSIMIACDVRVASVDSDYGEVIDQSLGQAVAMFDFLADRIDKAKSNGDSLEIVWESDKRLLVIDSWSGYESFVITHANGVIVV